MTKENAEDGDRELLHSFDPLSATLKAQLKRDIQDRSHIVMSVPGRVRLRWETVRFRVSSAPVSSIFIATAALALFAAVYIAIFHSPIWGHTTDEFVEIVVAAGSATAFGSIVFSVTGIAFGRAAEIAPGYTISVLHRWLPWIVGWGIIVTSGITLLLSAFAPTRSGAIAAVLLAVSAVTWSWLAVRRSLSKGDPMEVARDAGLYYKKATRRSARYAHRVMVKSLPKALRTDPESIAMLTRDHQRAMVVGVFRQLRTGVQSTAGQGRLTESVMLFEALVDAFDEYAASVEGEIGPHDELLGVVLEAFDSVEDACIHHDDNEAANYGIRQITRLAGKGYTNSDYSAVRYFAADRLTKLVDRTWDNDETTVPAASVTALGEMVVLWAATGAYEDAIRGIESLAEVARRALLSRRIHIGAPAVVQLVKVLPEIAGETRAPVRKQYLDAWSAGAVGISTLGPLEPMGGLYGVADALVPGISLGSGESLQQTIWSVPPDASLEVAASILQFLEGSVAWVHSGEAEERTVEKGLSEYFTVAYQVLLLLVARVDQIDGVDIATRILAFVASTMQSDPGARSLRSDDVAEVVWSILLAAGAIGVPDDQIASSAEQLIECLEIEGWGSDFLHFDAYLFSFVVGLLILSGRKEAEIAAWEDRVLALDRGPAPFSWQYKWGFHIEGLGRSPSTNRNRVAAAAAVFGTVNQGALRRWPLLGSTGKVNTG